MKRLLWLCSGILSVFILSFANSLSASAFSVEDYTNLPLFYIQDFSFTSNNAIVGNSTKVFPSILYSFRSNAFNKPVTLNNLRLIPSNSYSFKSGDVQKFRVSINISSGNYGMVYCPIGNSSNYTLIDCQITAFGGGLENLNSSSITDNVVKSWNAHSSYTYNMDLVIRFDKDLTLTSSTPILFEGGFFRNLPDTTAPFDFSNINSTITVLPQGTFRPKTTQSVQDAINDASDQAHKDSQAQLDYEKEQAKKEEEQRKKDEQDAQNKGDQSQTDSDDAQSDVDNASKNLFQILTDFAGAITGTSAGDCNITGDFGFFNAGNINLCTGASKITPITNVVGSVMLIGLAIPAVITLLHRFIALYNEVTG